MPVVSLQGTTISWSCEGLAVDPLADVLALFEPAPPAERAVAAVHVDLRPATARTAADPREEGWVPSFFHGAIQAYHGPPGFLLWDRSSRVRVPLDGSSASAEVVPPGEERHAGSTPVLFQIALTLVLRRARLFHLHAAALVHPSGGAVLVAGSSGAGKTTTALALIEAGYDYLGDDALFLQAIAASAGSEADRAPVARAVAFPRAFHLGPRTLAAFPRLLPLAGPAPPRTDKRPIDPRAAFPGRFRAEVPIAPGEAIALFPSIGGGPATELSHLSKADAFGHFLSSSAALVVDGMPYRDDNLALLRALVGAASCHELRLGADALSAPVAAVAPRIEAARRAPAASP